MKPLSWYSDLADSGFRREQGFFIVEGSRAISQILAASAQSIDEILVADEAVFESAGKGFTGPVRTLTGRQFKSICTAKTPQGVAAVVRIPENTYEQALPKMVGDRVLLLEGVQDPGNVGALIRSAAAFDYTGIVMNGECADPFGPKAVQASAGSIMAVWIRRTEHYLDVAKNLQNKGFSLVAADIRGEPLVSSHLRKKHVIVLGNEGNGLSDRILSMAERRIRISMNDKNAESLNVAVSGAIMMYTGAMTR